MTQAVSPRFRASLIAQIPMSRGAQPQEVATVALFLASDDGSYFTGQWLPPNGGLFMG